MRLVRVVGSPHYGQRVVLLELAEELGDAGRKEERQRLAMRAGLEAVLVEELDGEVLDLGVAALDAGREPRRQVLGGSELFQLEEPVHAVIADRGMVVGEGLVEAAVERGAGPRPGEIIFEQPEKVPAIFVLGLGERAQEGGQRRFVEALFHREMDRLPPHRRLGGVGETGLEGGENAGRLVCQFGEYFGDEKIEGAGALARDSMEAIEDPCAGRFCPVGAAVSDGQEEGAYFLCLPGGRVLVGQACEQGDERIDEGLTVAREVLDDPTPGGQTKPMKLDTLRRTADDLNRCGGASPSYSEPGPLGEQGCEFLDEAVTHRGGSRDDAEQGGFDFGGGDPARPQPGEQVVHDGGGRVLGEGEEDGSAVTEVEVLGGEAVPEPPEQGGRRGDEQLLGAAGPMVTGRCETAHEPAKEGFVEVVRCLRRLGQTDGGQDPDFLGARVEQAPAEGSCLVAVTGGAGEEEGGGGV